MVHIKRFVDRLKHFESRGISEFTCSISDAHALHSDITKLLADLYVQDNLNNQTETTSATVELTGGEF
jgi:hypothetical protein